MQDYKSLCAAAVIWATLVNIQSDGMYVVYMHKMLCVIAAGWEKSGNSVQLEVDDDRRENMWDWTGFAVAVWNCAEIMLPADWL